jgi:hypothetical protein
MSGPAGDRVVAAAAIEGVVAVWSARLLPTIRWTSEGVRGKLVEPWAPDGGGDAGSSPRALGDGHSAAKRA